MARRQRILQDMEAGFREAHPFQPRVNARPASEGPVGASRKGAAAGDGADADDGGSDDEVGRSGDEQAREAGHLREYLELAGCTFSPALQPRVEQPKVHA